MFLEEKIINKAEKYYSVGRYIPNNGIMNWNHRVIKGLSDMMLSIWNDWKDDTRHYKPTITKYNYYIDTIKRGESRLDPLESEYQLAKQVVKESRIFIDAVVLYRIHRKCRVF